MRKKDAMQLLLGNPAYADDVTPHDCLVVKVLRSPHAHALIEEINTDIALKVPGIECGVHLERRAAEAVHHGRADLSLSPRPATGCCSTGACALWATRSRSSRARAKKRSTRRCGSSR